jgi:FAD/FMN-containing dehydrogenase
MSSSTTVDRASVERLERRVRGQVATPGQPGYDEARRVWNGMIDRYPEVVVRCTGPADVAEAVHVARAQDLLLAVKGGGHSFAGLSVCDGGLLIDLSPMRGVRVDRAAMTATVQGGATWADVDHETQAHGLATTGGLVSSTGVGGLTLGGGKGWLGRKHGLALDNLVGVDLVTADGRLVRASADERPDLFWGLRGGGGNFGVVTSFEFQLHPVGPQVLGGPIFHPLDAAGEALRFYRDFAAGAPDELACYAIFAPLPPVDEVPAELQGTPGFVFAACYAGDLDDGSAALAPLRAFGQPLLDGIAPVDYAALQQAFDAGAPAGGRYYTKAHYLDALTDQAIETIVACTERMPGEMAQLGIEPMGGAIGRVPVDATAFSHRDAAFSIGIWPGWTDPDDDEQRIAWARECHAAVAPHATGGVYVNYLDGDEAARVPAAYGPNHTRLAKLKQAWDPDNLFRMNQNIDPRT